MQTYFVYSELLVDRPTENQLNEIVCSFKKQPTFQMLASINMFLALFPPNTNSEKAIHIQSFLMANLLDEALLKLVNERLQGEFIIDRPIFHRQQLLTLMRKVLLEASDEEGLDPNESKEARYLLGKACLLMSEFLLSPDQHEAIKSDNPLEAHDSILTELLVQWSPPGELMNPPNIIHAIGRSFEYFRVLAQETANFNLANGESVALRFSQLTGLTLQQHLKMIYCIYIWYNNQELPTLLNNPSNFNIDKSTYFSTTSISEDEINSFFHLDARSIQDLSTDVGNAQTGLRSQYDFTVFRKYPLVYLSEHIITCIDISFLVEKLASGVYHAILNSLSVSQDRNRFSGYWGKTFEIYVTSLFRQIYPYVSGRFYDLPNFDIPNADYEGFDGVLDYGNAMIVMEYKGGYLSASAKYSGDSALFLAELNKKFGRDRHAGIEQLGRKLELLFNINISSRRSIRGISFEHARKIYPVLVIQEPFLQIGLANWKLNKLFQEELQSRALAISPSIQPLVIISIEDLEKVLPYIDAGVSLVSLLEHYNTAGYEPHVGVLEALHEYCNRHNIPPCHGGFIWEKFQNIQKEIRASINE